MLKIIFPLLFIILSTSIWSQNNKVDSIKNIIPNQQDTTLVKSFHQLTLQYIKLEDYKNAQFYNQKSLTQLVETPDSSLFIFVSNYSGIIYLKLNELDSAIHVYGELIKYIGDNPNYSKYTIGAYGNRSLCYGRKDLSHKALDDLITALEVAKKHNQKKYIGILYGSLAMIFHGQEEYEKAIEYHFEAIEVKRELDNQHSLAISYENLAISFSKVKKYNHAFEYFEKSSKIFKSVNDQVGLALCNFYTSKTYHQLYEQNYVANINEGFENNSQSFLDSALLLNRTSFDQLKAIENVFYIAEVEIEYAKVLISAKRYNHAESILKQLIPELEGKYSSKESNVTKQLYEINKIKNNYPKALKWHERYLIIEDSLNNKNTLKELGKKQAELAFNKEQELNELRHHNKIKNLNFENEKEQIIEENKRKKQSYIIIVISIALFFILIFFLLVLKKWKITQKQKETINTQKLLIEKEKKATEDSINYARNIQKAAFPTLAEVKKTIPNNFILFNPKDIVSGDFYWANQIGNKRFIALADCTGHGVPGAFMTLISLNILNQIIADGVSTPTTILEQLHLRLQKRLNNQNGNSSKHGLDIALCMIEDQKLTYSGVHIPVYLIRNGNLN